MKTSIQILLIVLITNLLIVACTNNNLEAQSFQGGNCYQEQNRKIINTVTNVKGTVINHSDPCGFLIKPDEALEKNRIGQLYPCTLAEKFKEDGKKVIFSGNIYETFELENICADYFEITEIKNNRTE